MAPKALKCQKCSAELVAGKRFCFKCGTRCPVMLVPAPPPAAVMGDGPLGDFVQLAQVVVDESAPKGNRIGPNPSPDEELPRGRGCRRHHNSSISTSRHQTSGSGNSTRNTPTPRCRRMHPSITRLPNTRPHCNNLSLRPSINRILPHSTHNNIPPPRHPNSIPPHSKPLRFLMLPRPINTPSICSFNRSMSNNNNSLPHPSR